MLKKTAIRLLGASALLIFAIGVLIGPVSQPQEYHDFSDQRSFFGIPNTWDVLSNIPFAIVGMWGVFLLLFSGKIQLMDRREKYPWIGVSIGLILTAIGSAYYHLAPNNSRLAWDRLAMTIFFTSFLSALMMDRIDAKMGLWLFPVLLAMGCYSVLHWSLDNDLRFYFGLQLFTASAAIVLFFTPSHYTRNRDLAIVILLLVLTYLLDRYDQQIAILTRDLISGHTLKHLVGALAGFWLIRMIWKRKIIHNAKGDINET